MKKIFVMLFCCFCFTAHAQIKTIIFSKTSFDNSGDTLHKVANIFCTSVGDALKLHYPSRVRSIVVELNYNSITNQYTLTYSAEIEPCINGEHDMYFEHAGALSFGDSLSLTKKDALSRMKQQRDYRIEMFQRAYKNHNKPSIHSDYVYAKNKYFVIYESFIVAR